MIRRWLRRRRTIRPAVRRGHIAVYQTRTQGKILVSSIPAGRSEFWVWIKAADE